MSDNNCPFCGASITASSLPGCQNPSYWHGEEDECDETHWIEDKWGNEFRVNCSNDCEY